MRDELGSAVVHGVLPPGHRESIDGFVGRTGASRSIVREAVRVLVGCGLLAAQRRTGLTVQQSAAWDVTDPLVIGWQLAGPHREQVLAELRALRRAVEPAAAAAAAARAPDATSREGLEALLAAADRLAAAAGPGGPAAFLQADRALHRSVLTLSGNAVFVRLGRVVTRALDERADIRPDVHDVALHGRLARAIADADAVTAEATMTEIIDRT
ncbi:FCD domain-containing protein [Curtobacterium sp. VKM Ac-1376]|uniref:FCD domain-containing protein n=1 Tax=Curtobacterium sp. VKM Ac-1376 TaxID=123312 RepID=UPI002B26E3EC|nr:FCD domain-containing protein [Curtobacterium sp. VKM Ac-1376]